MQAGIVFLQGEGHRPGCAARKNHNPKTLVAQHSGALHRRLAAFNHVGQQRNAPGKALAGLGHLLGGAQGFNEKRIHPAGQVSLGAFHGGFKTFDGQCIGARQNQGL